MKSVGIQKTIIIEIVTRQILMFLTFHAKASPYTPRHYGKQHSLGDIRSQFF